MQAVSLDVSVLDLLQRFFSEVKSKTQINSTLQHDLNKAIGNASLHIMLADDDDDDYEFFAEALAVIMPQVRLTRASDGLELINILKTTGDDLPAIIFLDLNMPCKNGLECLDAIKSNQQWKGIPVLIYSTSAHIDQVNHTYKSGANLYIQKPHSYNEILSVIKKIFSLNLQDLALQPQREEYLLKI